MRPGILFAEALQMRGGIRQTTYACIRLIAPTSKFKGDRFPLKPGLIGD